jgi:LysM repeat protein
MSIRAQDNVRLKDVILDGKPAKLNAITGEITLINLNSQSVQTDIDSVKTKSKPVLITDSISTISLKESKLIEDNTSDFYIVKEGDNLFKLSVMYKTSLNELKKANNLETTLIQKGQKLRIRNFDVVTKNSNPSFWIVKEGDNLYRIALENGTTVKRLKSLNGLKTDTIKIGQKLKIQ